MPDPTQEIPTVFFSFGDGALTLFGRPFQGRLPRKEQSDVGLLQPPPTNRWVWAVPLSLATTQGISIDVFSSVTEMFQFTE